jgi:hypothetical protein
MSESECNPHPKAPHGLNREASYTNGRYTCVCEGWDAYEAGYQNGYNKCLEADHVPDTTKMVNQYQNEIIDEMAIQGHASTTDAIRWAMNREREACAKLLETTDLGGLKDNPAMQSLVAEMLLAYVNAIRARGQA